VETIPGASAITAAVSLAGIAGNQFTFLGFAPNKKGRQTFFKKLNDYDVQPVIFFESTHRIMKALAALVDTAPIATIYIARELTKIYEEMLIGTPAELLTILETEPVRQKGEFVVLVDCR
jgi:16S rRNA (cytidine1402-2'-O)-methyltransferase